MGFLLQHCSPPDLHRFLNELPKTLDETYDGILKRINEAQKDNARRLIQCLTVASRPLRVEEIAELLAFDCRASSSGGLPKLENWRWDDHEEVILSTCSSLITIVPDSDSQVVQFSHFSVKEYLTSPRLARSPCVDVSQFHIDLEAAHTVMAQACLATLLRPDEHDGKSDAKRSPLVKYASQYWVKHAQFEDVSSRVQDGMDDLFDSSKPHFVAWLKVHDIDERWPQFSIYQERHGSPLYYAAFCGFYDLAERLITKHPDQVNARGGRIHAPLPAALYKKHFRLANLLHKHGADVDCRGLSERTPIHAASCTGSVDVMRWLLNHGADANTRGNLGITPLHLAARFTQIECVQVLLDHNANINLQDDDGRTPLCWATELRRDHTLDTVRRLLERGADPNIYRHSTPLHQASSCGSLEVARLLLSYGAKVNVRDKEGRTPFLVAASIGHHQITKLLLEHGAVPLP
jgi:ankyrin repeat protein